MLDQPRHRVLRDDAIALFRDMAPIVSRVRPTSRAVRPTGKGPLQIQYEEAFALPELTQPRIHRNNVPVHPVLVRFLPHDPSEGCHEGLDHCLGWPDRDLGRKDRLDLLSAGAADHLRVALADADERPVDTLCRELHEELDLRIDAAQATYLGNFSAPAANEPGLEVVGTAATEAEVLQRLAEVEVNMVLIDVRLAGKNGLPLAERLLEHYPELLCLILSGHGETTYIRHAFRAGARGYILKGKPAEILEAIQVVNAGGMYLSPALQEKLSGAGE